MTESDMLELVGDRGGSWRCDLGRQIGHEGGFGTVYEATGSDGTPVAIKLTHPDLRRELDPHLIEREREIAEKLAAFPMTNIIRTLDWGTHEESVFLVMERAEESLADHLDRVGPLDDLEAADALKQVSLGLKEIHSVGVIHRDLSSANILRLEGRWKISDFGISRDSDVGTRQVTFKARHDIGNPCYKAPELWEGGSPDARSDLYALGCVAFEVLSGRPPFEGTWDEIRQKHLLEPPPALPHCHIALQSAVARLMTKDPKDRLPSAETVSVQLSSVGAPDDDLTSALLQAATQHFDERARLDAEEAAVRERARRVDQARNTAREELRQLSETAAQRIRAAVPDLQFAWRPFILDQHDVHGALLRCVDAQLMIGVWPESLDVSWDQDTLLLAGEIVVIGRRDAKRAHRLGNVVYESRDGKTYGWHLYRFVDSPIRQGDPGHGFSATDFRAKRHPMLSQIYDGWQLNVTPMTPENISALFVEALSLPVTA